MAMSFVSQSKNNKQISPDD